MEELDRHKSIVTQEFNRADTAVSNDTMCADAATAHEPEKYSGKSARTAEPISADEEVKAEVEAKAKAKTKAREAAEADEDVPKISRKVRRRRRRSRPRSKTIAMKRLTREELRKGALMYPPVDIPRPSTRAECMVEARPCPWVACKHHLYLDVNPITGSIKINFPDLEPWQLTETCALDVAERGGITLEEVGDIMNLTRERIRQVEVRGLGKLRSASPSPEELGTLMFVDDESC